MPKTGGNNEDRKEIGGRAQSRQIQSEIRPEAGRC